MDVKLQFKVLQKQLVQLGFSNWNCIVEEDVYKGSPYVYCLFIRFLLVVFADKTRTFIEKYPFFIVEEDDARLATSTLRLLSLEYQYVSPISSIQFMRPQFALAKINICLSMIENFREKKPLVLKRSKPQPKAITLDRSECLIEDRRLALNSITRS